MDAELNGQMESDTQRLRHLQEEHNRYSQRLEALLGKPYLSEDEKLEEVRLKKLKLYLKDQMWSLGRASNRAIPVA